MRRIRQDSWRVCRHAAAAASVSFGMIAASAAACGQAGDDARRVQDNQDEQGTRLIVDQAGIEAEREKAKLERDKALMRLVDDSWRRMDQEHELWFDAKNKQAIVGGTICFREGPLEMFACPAGTKEHESIVSVNSSAELVHAILLAAGAVPGKPVQWEPEYVPASGPTILVTVVWMDGETRKEVDARQLVKDRTTGKPLAQRWVFCGSGQWTDPDTGRRQYFADYGDMICVSNFSSAMMDLPIESSQINANIRFVALTENIPMLGTPVLLKLKPQPKSEPAEAAAPDRTNDGKTDTGARG